MGREMIQSRECKKCHGSGRCEGLVEVEPGSGRKFISTTAECRSCVTGLKLLVARLERYIKTSMKDSA